MPGVTASDEDSNAAAGNPLPGGHVEPEPAPTEPTEPPQNPAPDSDLSAAALEDEELAAGVSPNSDQDADEESHTDEPELEDPGPGDEPEPEIGGEADDANAVPAAEIREAAPSRRSLSRGRALSEAEAGRPPPPITGVRSGIPSQHLAEAVTTGRAPGTYQPARKELLQENSSISYELVVDTQVARRFRPAAPTAPGGPADPPPLAELSPPLRITGLSGRSSTPSPSPPASHRAAADSSSPGASDVDHVTLAPVVAEGVREVKAPTSDHKMSVCIPALPGEELRPRETDQDADDDTVLTLHRHRQSPEKSLLHREASRSWRGLSRALSDCLREGLDVADGDLHLPLPRPGAPSPLSLLSSNVSDIDWKLWWTERLQRLDERVQKERQNTEARLMRECLSLTAYTYSLGAHLLPRLLGLQPAESSGGSPASLTSSTSLSPTAASAGWWRRPGLHGTAAARRAPHGVAAADAGSPFAASPSRASRRVSFSDFGFSMTAQPPSSAHSKPRRPGDKRPVVLEEPSAYLRFLRRSDRAAYKPSWRLQPDDILTDTRADQVVSELCQWMQQLSAAPASAPSSSPAAAPASASATATALLPAAAAPPAAAPAAASVDAELQQRAALSCDDVRKLFDINLEGPAARALAVHVRELSCVPATLAADARAPQQSCMARVRAAVRADLLAEARPRRTHAFGRSLPNGDAARWRPPRGHARGQGRRWRLDCVPAELATMEEVFGGVTHLKVTRDFVDYLRHKEAPLPPCLRPSRPARPSRGRAPRRPPHPAVGSDTGFLRDIEATTAVY